MTDNKKNPFYGLNNIRVLRAAAREAGYEQMEEIREKLNAIVDDMREEEQASSAREAERIGRIEKYRQMLLQDGIDPSELAGAEMPPKKKMSRAPHPARFRYTDAEGNVKTWTGQGRTPTVIAQALKAGKFLEDFLI